MSLNQLRCDAGGCERQARGSAAGVPCCGPHYQRWAKYGSFELPARPEAPSKDGLCTVPGCQNQVQSKNSLHCATHFFRIKRGSPDGLAPRRTTCLRCTKPLTGNRSKYCSRVCLARHAMPLTKICRVCQEQFEPRGKWEVCSRECSAIHVQRWENDPRTREQKKMRGAKRRAIQRGVQLEDFYFSEIFRRDKWICKICDTPVDRTKTFPHHLSPSIDHIIPLCKGGPHRRFNVQCAHWICNIRKSHKPMAKREPPVCA